MKLRVWEVGDKVRTPTGRKAEVIRVGDSYVTIRYEGVDPHDMATFTVEAAGAVLKFADE